MAPVDRNERRQQRMRGAGTSSAQNSFQFNFNALSRPAKQNSLPPIRSSRRTPIRSTSRGPSASASSARRHRSASLPRSASARRSAFVQPSSSTKRPNTPGQDNSTPSLGKRKRGSKHAQLGPQDDEEDELSPDRDRDGQVRSIEKSRRVAGAISTIHEENDDLQDELSMISDVMNSVQKTGEDAPTVPQETPVPASAHAHVSLEGASVQTPLGSRATTSRREDSRLSKKSRSLEPAPTTPSISASFPTPQNGYRSASASQSGPDLATPGMAQNEEAEDELTPTQADIATPRVISTGPQQDPSPQEDEEIGDDDLSPVQPAETPLQPSRTKQQQKPNGIRKRGQSPEPKAASRRQPPRVVEAEDDEDVVHVTPPATKPQRTRKKSVPVEEAEDDVEADEISPEAERAKRRPARPTKSNKEVVNISSGEESSDNYNESEQEEEPPDPTPRPAPIPRRMQEQKQRSKHASDRPLKKRQKRDGPTQAINVMRLKGSRVKGLTVADTTRASAEEYIDHRVERLVAKVQSTEDRARQRRIKAGLNLTLAYKEALAEKMLDLQDLNDCITGKLYKLKAFKRKSADMRREILEIQNSRLETAIEQDNVQLEFEDERNVAEASNKLSTSMFDIQAAIQAGRARAREEGREDEGPEIPLGMLLDDVSRAVGSIGGGLLAGVSGFNRMLERKVGFLEGKA